MTAIFKTINNTEQTSIPIKIKDKNKQCRIINEVDLIAYIKRITV